MKETVSGCFFSEHSVHDVHCRNLTNMPWSRQVRKVVCCECYRLWARRLTRVLPGEAV